MFQIPYIDTFEDEQLFSPLFNKEFLWDLLDLQFAIENITTENGVTLQEVCNAPLSPQDNTCNIQSIWAYWQDDPAALNLTGVNSLNNHTDTYLDHFLLCSR